MRSDAVLRSSPNRAAIALLIPPVIARVIALVIAPVIARVIAPVIALGERPADAGLAGWTACAADEPDLAEREPTVGRHGA